MRPLRVELTPALAYWTVVDDDWCPVPVADAYLRHLRLGRDRAEGTTRAYAGDGALPVTLVAFDVLWLDGEPTVDLPDQKRRRKLLKLNLSGTWQTVPSFDVNVFDVMEACASLGLEGMVAKRVDSLYRPGVGSDDWLKIKTTQWKALAGLRRHAHA